MALSRRNILVFIAAATLMVSVGFLSQPNPVTDTARIIDGSRVLVLYQMRIRGEEVPEAPHFAQFVQGRHQFLPALERVVKGKKTEDRAAGWNKGRRRPSRWCREAGNCD